MVFIIFRAPTSDCTSLYSTCCPFIF